MNECISRGFLLQCMRVFAGMLVWLFESYECERPGVVVCVVVVVLRWQRHFIECHMRR